MARKYKKNAQGIYQTTISTGKYTEDGKPIIVHLSASTSTELEKKVAETKTAIGRGTYADDKGKTFGEYAIHWLETYPKANVETSTYLKYQTTVKKHLAGISNIRLLDVTKSDVQKLITVQKEHPDNQRMIKITVNQILESAIDDGLLYRNVSKSIKVKAPEKSTRHRALTDEEKETISGLKKKHAFTEKEQLYVDTLFCTGMRPEEILALTYSDIRNCVVDVNKALTWKGGKHIKAPKSNAGYRQIDVPQWYQDEVMANRRNTGSLYLFPQQDGDPLSQSSYKRFWNRIYNKINMEMGGTERIIKNNVYQEWIAATDLVPYMFRHNYCTLLYYSKVDIKDACRIMGHSNIKITLEIYTHLDAQKSSTKSKMAGIAL